VRASDDYRRSTVTVVVHELDRFSASTAVQTSGVLPTENFDPDAGEQVTATGVAPPVAFGIAKATFVPAALLVVTVSITGQAITGGGGTLTTTDVEQVATCLAASVAVHTTCVIPGANRLPDAGVQMLLIGATPPSVVGAL
jgi:hypothetical protein